MLERAPKTLDIRRVLCYDGGVNEEHAGRSSDMRKLGMTARVDRALGHYTAEEREAILTASRQIMRWPWVSAAWMVHETSSRTGVATRIIESGLMDLTETD